MTFRHFTKLRTPFWAITLFLMFNGCDQTEKGLPIIKEFFIPLSDGVQLAADFYLPYDFDSTRRYPIILEYLPYRKDEHQRSRYGVFNYFVQHDYLVARVDIRGTGRSEGEIVPYEYSDRELDDGEEVIQFLSELDFSNGNVAVFGISWGGFNGLQLAMRKPPALKTIISLMSTDDLYQDDVHFMDGILHVDAYEIGRDLDNSLPASPDFILDSAYFKNRFFSEPWFLKYKKQQRDGRFWDRASLDGQYENYDTPTFLIAGLYDGYRDLVERFLDQTNGPKRALIGPWNHTWPHAADFTPMVEWRKEVVDWLDRWMRESEKPRQNDYPELIYYQRDYHEPGLQSGHLPGEWKVINKWSESKRESLRLNLFSEDLTMGFELPKEQSADSVKGNPSDGMEGGGPVMWWGDWPPDQSPFDHNCLIYDMPIEEEISVTGYPIVNLCVKSDKPHVNWFARLNDVAPDGQVTLVTGAGFNSTHIKSASEPKFNPIDSSYCLEIELHWMTWNFKPGHKLRISISNAQWPMFWPAPESGVNQVLTGGVYPSFIELPTVLGASAGYKWEEVKPDPSLPDFDIISHGTSSGFAEVSEVEYDSITRTKKVIAVNEWDENLPWGTYRNRESIIHSTNDLDPANTSVEAAYSIDIQLVDRNIQIETELRFSSDADSLYYDYVRKISENGKFLKGAHWKENFRRDFQ